MWSMVHMSSYLDGTKGRNGLTIGSGAENGIVRQRERTSLIARGCVKQTIKKNILYDNIYRHRPHRHLSVIETSNIQALHEHMTFLSELTGDFCSTFTWSMTCRGRTLTPSDTWSRPIWYLHILKLFMLRLIFFKCVVIC